MIINEMNNMVDSSFENIYHCNNTSELIVQQQTVNLEFYVDRPVILKNQNDNKSKSKLKFNNKLYKNII